MFTVWKKIAYQKKYTDLPATLLSLLRQHCVLQHNLDVIDLGSSEIIFSQYEYGNW